MLKMFRDKNQFQEREIRAKRRLRRTFRIDRQQEKSHMRIVRTGSSVFERQTQVGTPSEHELRKKTLFLCCATWVGILAIPAEFFGAVWIVCAQGTPKRPTHLEYTML